MNLELIDTFLDLLDTRNFGRTAERLETTQSTVSGRIKALEKAVGTRLFYRGRAGAMATPSGLRFEQHARSLKAAWRHARRDVGGLEYYEGTLRVSGQFSLMQTLFLDWIEELHATDKRVSLQLEADSSPKILSDIAEGAVDIGLVFAPQFLPDLSIEQIGGERLVMVSTDFANISDVTAERYIRACYTAYVERTHAELLPHLAHSPITAGYEELAIGLMTRLGGTAYLPERAIHRLQITGVDLRRIADAPEMQQPVYVAMQRRRRHDPLLNRAIRALTKAAEAHFAPSTGQLD